MFLPVLLSNLIRIYKSSPINEIVWEKICLFNAAKSLMEAHIANFIILF